MDVLRPRFGLLAEWSVAALFLAATLAVGFLVVRELRTMPLAAPARAEEPAPSLLPAAVPSQAISVPVLLLLDGREIRVGDTAERVAEVLGPDAELGEQVNDRGALGDRRTHFYEHAGTRFILVFEPFELKGRPRVAAIYLR